MFKNNRNVKSITIEYDDGTTEIKEPYKSKMLPIIGMIVEQRLENGEVNIRLTKDDIVNKFSLDEEDRCKTLSYFATWIRAFIVKFYDDIKVSYRRNEKVILIYDKINKENKGE